MGIDRHIIRTPEDRHRSLSPGMLVAYWHWETIGGTHRRTGKAIEPKDHDGSYLYRGIVELFDPETSLPNREHHVLAEKGELVIRLLDRDGETPLPWYERLLHLAPMHETDFGKRHLTEPELQRWFPLGVDPNEEDRKPGTIHHIG